jgi:type II secretory pathway component PulK
MKTFLHSRDGASKGAALMIVLAMVVLLTGVALAYFSRTTTDRQLAQSSYNDTSADLLARSALDIVVGDFKQEIINTPTVNYANIQATPYPAPIPTNIPNLIRYSSQNAAASRASNVSSAAVSANGRSISTARWNSHYLVPRGNTGTTIDSSPVPSFVAPDWVLVTLQGPNSAPAASSVIGRYAFAVYDEGGLLDMSLAGFPSWSGNLTGSCNPAPTPWVGNIGWKGTVGFADLTGLGTYAPPQTQIDKIVGWRNYATSQRTFTDFPNVSPGFAGETDCTKQDAYGDYLLYFGEPPFTFDIDDQPVPISSYPFSSVYPTTSSSRTDQALMTRQELLRLRNSLGFSQNVLQYMGTFSRERNKPAPDWPHLGYNLSEGRFSFENLDLVKPNPQNCNHKGKGKGQGKSRGRGHLCGEQEDIVNLFGLLWTKSIDLPPDPNGNPQPGRWRYINHVGKNWDPNPNPHGKINCWRGPKKQNDFFQILHFALYRLACAGGQQPGNIARTFAIGASLIDQFDSDPDDLDNTLTGQAKKWQTHTTVIEYAPGLFAYGMETTDVNYDDPGNQAGRRPYGAPNPVGNPTMLNHAFSTIGEFGYAIDTSDASQPTLNFYSASSSDAAVLDFFSYNPINSVYPRAGIVNLNTKNVPALASIIKGALSRDGTTNYVNQTAATNAAQAIVTATTAQPALTRADVARLAQAAGGQIGSTEEEKETIARVLAELGQTRTWNLMIDVIAQTGRYAPGTASVTAANKFSVEGEKRYWLHIALGRDLNDDGSVDVLGTQLEEVIE